MSPEITVKNNIQMSEINVKNEIQLVPSMPLHEGSTVIQLKDEGNVSRSADPIPGKEENCLLCIFFSYVCFCLLACTARLYIVILGTTCLRSLTEAAAKDGE